MAAGAEDEAKSTSISHGHNSMIRDDALAPIDIFLSATALFNHSKRGKLADWFTLRVFDKEMIYRGSNLGLKQIDDNEQEVLAIVDIVLSAAASSSHSDRGKLAESITNDCLIHL
jgi:hypothetical protein